MLNCEKIMVLFKCNMLNFLGIYEYFKMWTYLAIFTLGKFELSFSPICACACMCVFQPSLAETVVIYTYLAFL